MSTAPWIQVEPSLEMRSKPLKKLQFTVFVSPHEVPQAVRSEFDKQLNRFVIEFRYLDDEEFKRVAVDNIVCLRVGKNSRRLLGIELDTVTRDVAKVRLEVHSLEREIKKAVDRLLQKESGKEERENYALAMKAIESKGALLLDPGLLAPVS
jgi:hypothetical protein